MAELDDWRCPECGCPDAMGCLAADGRAWLRCHRCGADDPLGRVKSRG